MMATRRTIQSATVLVCSLALMPLNALAWSAEAHRVIAMVAANRLKGSSTSDSIAKILGNLTLADIATCPDEVRDLEEHGTAMSATCKGIFPNPPKGTAQWHFVNTPVMGAAFTPTAQDVTAACMNVCALVR